MVGFFGSFGDVSFDFAEILGFAYLGSGDSLIAEIILGGLRIPSYDVFGSFVV